MNETKKTETTEPCCTVKVIVEGDGAAVCCVDAKGERVIKVALDPEDLNSGKTIKVVCCPDQGKAE